MSTAKAEPTATDSGAERASEPDDRAAPPEPGLDETWAALFAQVRAAGVQIERLLAIRLDRARLRLRAVVVRAIAAVVLVVVALTTVVVAVLYLLSGLAGAFAAVLGERPWAGRLAVGVLVLAGGGVAAAVAARRSDKRELERLTRKYGERTERRDDGGSDG